MRRKMKHSGLRKTVIAYLAILISSLFSATAFANEKTLVIAVDATKAPMEFMGDDGKVSGFEIDFIRAVAKEAGFTPEFKNVAWKDIFTGLEEKKYDAICASVSITEARQQKYTFSEPYINISQAIVVAEQSAINGKDDLEGKKIAAKAKTTSFKAAETIKDAKVAAFANVEKAMAALRKGEADAVVCDGPVAAFFTAGKDEHGLKIAGLLPAKKQEQYGMVIRKDDKETTALLNKGILAVKQQLIDIELQKKWFATLFSKK
jgi:polar amino acid transport system substrate-binding protein